MNDFLNNDLSDLNFNASEIEPSSSFDPIPAGDYSVYCSSAEIKDTKDGTGKYISCRFTVYEGEFNGRLIFQNITIKNRSEKATEIGKRDLSAFCRAVGVFTPKDTSELTDKPLVIKVGIQPASDGYEARNNVKAYKGAGENVAQPIAPKPAPAVPVAAKKPWQK